MALNFIPVSFSMKTTSTTTNQDQFLNIPFESKLKLIKTKHTHKKQKKYEKSKSQ